MSDGRWSLATTAQPMPNEVRGHIPALDGLRGLAILLVMLHHQTVMRASTWFDEFLLWPLKFGFCGVDLFFVLSGFLITGILLDAKGKHRYFLNFYGRRVLRIFPLYYAIVFVSLVVLPQLSHPKVENFSRVEGDEIWYWLHLSNFSIAWHGAWRHGVLDISWSLAIEEQFYLFWPMFVAFVRRRTLIVSCFVLVVLAMVFRCGLVAMSVKPIVTYVLTFSRLDALATGALIAAVLREGIGVAKLLQPARVTATIATVCIVMVMLTSTQEGWRATPMLTAGFSLFALLFGAVLVLALDGSRNSVVKRTLCWGPLRWLGKYSYALYLFHLPARAVVRDVIYGPAEFATCWGSQLPGQLVFYLLAFAVTLPAAWASWHLYEKHFLALKRYFEFDVAAEDTAAAASGTSRAISSPPPTSRKPALRTTD